MKDGCGLASPGNCDCRFPVWLPALAVPNLRMGEDNVDDAPHLRAIEFRVT
jgi:hypothetical protein